ncbi:MAG TPA: hypothetical protein VGJ13_08830 [Pseudonocardiaceae bacterium]|jgi:hypothetical protein
MRPFARSAALALAVALASGTALAGGAASAQADQGGGLIVIPGSGSDLTAIRVRTSAGCPAAANAYYARMTGRGFPPDGQVVTANTAAGLSHSVGFDAYFLLIMRDYANRNHATLAGQYKITVFCVDRLTLQDYREFTGSLEFTDPTHYEALGAAKQTGPPPPPLALAGDGSALDPAQPAPPAGTAPPGTVPPGTVPAGTPSVAGPPASTAQPPGPTAGSPTGINPQPPMVADRQLSSPSGKPPGQRWPWLILGASALLTPVAVVAVNRLRKRRAR